MSHILRRAGAAVVAILAVTAIVACAATGNDNKAEDAAEPASDGFPVTLTTNYGVVELDEKPERIVAISGEYPAALLELGVEPVAFWIRMVEDADDIAANYPWLDGVDAELLDTELVDTFDINLEKVAFYKPDLILAPSWSVDPATRGDIYEQLSAIAPVYSGPVYDGPAHSIAAPFTWRETLTDLATLTGADQELATEAIDEVDAKFADARERLSGLQGGSYYAGAVYDGIIASQIPQPWFEDLGMKPMSGVEWGDKFSQENITELTADVLWISVHTQPEARETFEADPRFAELPASKNNTVLYGDLATSYAYSDASSRSVLWILEQIVSQLENSPANQ